MTRTTDAEAETETEPLKRGGPLGGVEKKNGKCGELLKTQTRKLAHKMSCMANKTTFRMRERK